MKIFGREPTLYIAALAAIIPVLGTVGFHWLTSQQATLIVAAIVAIFGAVNAYMVRPVSPVAFTYALAAVVALFAGYGYNLSAETVAALNGVVLPLLALLTRGQVAPQETALSRS